MVLLLALLVYVSSHTTRTKSMESSFTIDSINLYLSWPSFKSQKSTLVSTPSFIKRVASSMTQPCIAQEYDIKTFGFFSAFILSLLLLTFGVIWCTALVHLHKYILLHNKSQGHSLCGIRQLLGTICFTFSVKCARRCQKIAQESQISPDLPFPPAIYRMTPL